MKLGIFLHFYQPPTQKREIVAQIVEESYLPIARLLDKCPRCKVTINITGSLLLLLDKYGYGNVIDIYRKLIQSGKIEIVGSSGYHAFLPKLPDEHVYRQIELQEHILHKYFGKDLHIRGFFPPEMAFTPKIGKIVQAKGYEWLLLDSYGKKGKRSYAPLYRDENGMVYFFRNREVSFKLVNGSISSSKELHDEFEDKNIHRHGFGAYRIVAMDGETFGHHRKNGVSILENLFNSKEIETVLISDILKMDLDVQKISPRKSSWTILDKKRSLNKPFLRWSDQENEIHKMQWKLTRMACEAQHNEKSQKLLDSALFSCQYWWACARPWWHIEMIESGAHALLRSIIDSSSTAIYKEKALMLYHNIVATSFKWMRTGKMQSRVDSEHEYLQHLKDAIKEPQKANW